MRHSIPILIGIATAGILFCFANTAHAAANVYYSVGQSTSTNLMTGTPTLTIASGLGTFNTAQTGNIGVGDQVTYGASSSIAYIASKVSQTQWNLETATGTMPANVTSMNVASINRAFASLEGAISGFTGANYLATSSLVGANVVVNIPCYYDSGTDASGVTIPSSIITGTSSYLNIFTPTNTSTQANYSQRDQGIWTSSGAYQLVVAGGGFAIDVRTNYVRITGLQVELNSSSSNQRVIRMDSISGSGGYVVIDSNIVRSQISGNPAGPQGIGSNDPIAAPTGVIVNNIVYDQGQATSSAIAIIVNNGTYYLYNNTTYNAYEAYRFGATGATTTGTYINDIAQDDVQGFAEGGGTNTLTSSTTDDLSDHNDAFGTATKDSVTLNFVSPLTDNFHLSAIDNAAIGQGANLTNDPNYAFTYDIDGVTRPTSTAWDLGAAEYAPVPATPPTIISFTLPATSSVLSVPITSFTATSTVNPIAGYLLTQSSSTPSSTNTGWATSTPSAYTFSSYGTQTLYAWVIDAYGNISSSTSQTVTITLGAPAQIYYSVGQSTSTNLMTGTPTLTIASGLGTFNTAQTGNIGVGDQVTYGASSSIAYIASKVSQTQWNLETATGTMPANVTSMNVASINRGFSSLAAAVSGMTGTSYLNNTSLVAANAIVNLPCYYDTGPDTAAVTIPSSTITGSSTYINIFTPNNTSTQVNVSQRHMGTWTSSGAWSLVAGTSSVAAIDIRTNYVRLTGLQLDFINDGSRPYERVIRMDSMAGSGGYIVLDSNIVQSQITGNPVGPQGIGSNDPAAAPTVVIVNNIVYDINGTSTTAGIYAAGGTYYIYNNTLYNNYNSYAVNLGASSVSTTVTLTNNIAQDDVVGFTIDGVAVLTSSSTSNLSDQADAPGLNPKNLMVVNFASTSTHDLHLAPFNPSTIGGAINLSSNLNYAFTDDADGVVRPSMGEWDEGAVEYEGQTYSATLPTISSFTMPSVASSSIVAITSFTATSSAHPVAAYLISQSSSVPSSTNPNWAATAPSAFTFNGAGLQTVYAWVMDAYGNISLSASQTVTITPYFATVDSSSSLPAAFFSMDWNHYLSGTAGSIASPLDWPQVPFGGLRLWDNYVSWEDIETASGTYNWAGLNNWLAAAQASGTDVLYTFGRTPPWASSNPSQSCNYGLGCAAPPSDVGSGDYIWKHFVTALVEHSLASPTAHIKYYELWNEPNTAGTWTGTDAQMVQMASDAYSIIHSLDPNAVVLGPSPSGTGLVSWLQGYYADGGASYQDAVAFHPYVGRDPSAVNSVITNLRALMATFDIASQPIYATEGSWGTTGLPSDQKAQWLAQEYLYLWSAGTSRFYWYTWDNSDQWGGLTNASGSGNGSIDETGITYANLQPWLVGSVGPSNPCYEAADATWYCSLMLANGDPAQILWNPNETVTKTVSPTFSSYQTLNTSTIGTDPSGAIVADSVSVGSMPILLVAKNASVSTITSFTMPPSATSQNVSVTSFTASEANGGIAEYLVTQSSATPSSTNPGWSSSVPSSFTFSGTGTETAYAWVMDSQGNISSSSTSATVTITPVSGGGGGSVAVASGGGGGSYIPPATVTSTTTTMGIPTSQLATLLTSLEAELQTLLQRAALEGISVSSSSTSFFFTRNLTIGSKGVDVRALQHYLDTYGFPVNATPGNAGSLGYETQYFGINTQRALAAFQENVRIIPDAGYFGPITRAYVDSH